MENGAGGELPGGSRCLVGSRTPKAARLLAPRSDWWGRKAFTGRARETGTRTAGFYASYKAVDKASETQAPSMAGLGPLAALHARLANASRYLPATASRLDACPYRTLETACLRCTSAWRSVGLLAHHARARRRSARRPSVHGPLTGRTRRRDPGPAASTRHPWSPGPHVGSACVARTDSSGSCCLGRGPSGGRRCRSCHRTPVSAGTGVGSLSVGAGSHDPEVPDGRPSMRTSAP